MNVKNVLPKDAIPSVEYPDFRPLSEVSIQDGETGDVIVVDQSSLRHAAGSTEETAGRNGVSKAYPVEYLHFHEIVNDVIADVPIAVTWCPLCGSAIVYDRRVQDNRGTVTGKGRSETADEWLELEFGVSGKLADDDLVMYDRQTDSEWKQSLGQSIAGPLKGTQLAVLPAAIHGWDEFRARDDQALVMEPPGGRSEAASADDEPAPIDYDAAPYEAYFERDGFGLGAHRSAGGRTWTRDDLDPKTIVLGIENGGDALGIPLPVVEDADGFLTTTVGGLDVVVFATDDGLHAFEDPGFDWRQHPGGFRGDDALYDGATGKPIDAPAAHTGEAGTGRSVAQLERVPAKRLFAFAWQDDHGSDAFLL